MRLKDKKKNSNGGVSRRDFLKIGGVTLAAAPVLEPRLIQAGGSQVEVFGPGKVAVTLNVNGKRQKVNVEPRVTLLEALRDHLDLTGAKRACDRGTCGACTVLLDGKAVYSCSVLAIDAQKKTITTVESLMAGGKLHPIQQAFIDNDAQQCGFCTPGFVVAARAFLDRNPNPRPEDFADGLAGNTCRCGTYVGVRAAVMQAAKGGHNA